MNDSLFIIGNAPLKVPREVVPGLLYQCCAPSAREIGGDGELIKKFGLKAIITVAHDIRIQVHSTLIHLHIPVDETNPTPGFYFDLACSLGRLPTLIHCMAGANRSRVFAAAIAHRVFKLPLEKCIELADPPPSGVVFESMMTWAKDRLKK